MLQPKRLETILSSLLDRRDERAELRREQLAELNRRITETDQRLNRLYDAIEAGLADLNDSVLKERMAGLKAIRDQATADAGRIQMTLDSSGNQSITVDMIGAFASEARNGLQLEGGGSRSRTPKSASWVRNRNCCECSWPLREGNRRHSAFIVLY